MPSPIVVVLIILAGALVRTVMPWLIQLQKEPETKFDKKYFVPLIAACAITIVTVPLIVASVPPEQLAAPLTLGGLAALFLVGYGANSIARDVQRIGERPTP